MHGFCKFTLVYVWYMIGLHDSWLHDFHIPGISYRHEDFTNLLLLLIKKNYWFANDLHHTNSFYIVLHVKSLTMHKLGIVSYSFMKTFFFLK